MLSAAFSFIVGGPRSGTVAALLEEAPDKVQACSALLADDIATGATCAQFLVGRNGGVRHADRRARFLEWVSATFTESVARVAGPPLVAWVEFAFLGTVAADTPAQFLGALCSLPYSEPVVSALARLTVWQCLRQLDADPGVRFTDTIPGLRAALTDADAAALDSWGRTAAAEGRNCTWAGGAVGRDEAYDALAAGLAAAESDGPSGPWVHWRTLRSFEQRVGATLPSDLRRLVLENSEGRVAALFSAGRSLLSTDNATNVADVWRWERPVTWTEDDEGQAGPSFFQGSFCLGAAASYAEPVTDHARVCVVVTGPLRGQPWICDVEADSDEDEDEEGRSVRFRLFPGGAACCRGLVTPTCSDLFAQFVFGARQFRTWAAQEPDLGLTGPLP